MILFTADMHFEHANIIKYCNRPFKNVQHMNKLLISRYNQVVKPEDTVYFIGDLTIKPRSYKSALYAFIQNLQGTKHLILGNHDYFEPFDYVDIGFESVHTQLEILDDGMDLNLLLVHDPAKAYTTDKIVIHGHIHDMWKKKGNAINVGVDVWDFKPVSILQIRKLIGEEDQ
jgi:calcineurin-like phosphoesterase family protein